MRGRQVGVRPGLTLLNASCIVRDMASRTILGVDAHLPAARSKTWLRMHVCRYANKGFEGEESHGSLLGQRIYAYAGNERKREWRRK